VPISLRLRGRDILCEEKTYLLGDSLWQSIHGDKSRIASRCWLPMLELPAGPALF
jgi:hypothetical protein